MSTLRSMTGFGSASSEDGAFSYRVEVRSVNHRHVQVKVRTPSDLAFVDAEVERLVKKKIERGTVSVHVHVEPLAGAARATVDAELAERYLAELRKLSRRLGVGTEISLATLTGLPGVVGALDGEEGEAEARGRKVVRLVREALDALIEMRAAEGQILGADVKKHVAAVAKVVERIDKRTPQVVRGHQRSLARRVEELLDGRELQPADVAREVALLADRLDTSEEVSRVASHLEQLDSTLARGGAVGRRLDFLVQELFREINTIGSKCGDAKVAHWVVDAKTHAERLREQVQNLE